MHNEHIERKANFFAIVGTLSLKPDAFVRTEYETVGLLYFLTQEGKMCDYSLMAIPNRLAVSGEELVIHRFEASAVGLASASDIRSRKEVYEIQPQGLWSNVKRFFNGPDAQAIPAVCIPPGARLLVRDIPARLQRECGFQEDAKEAVFTQLTAAVNTFRDAIRFQNGVEVVLQRFAEGQRVRVLDLSSSEEQESALDGKQLVMV